MLRLNPALILLPALLVGCGESLEEFPTAATTGVVTCNGSPVANVRVYFAPKPTGQSAIVGKSGWATTAEDGTFSISTYSDEDGAVVGPNRISVDSPHPEKHPDFNCDCETDSTKVLMEVTISETDENRFEIALPAKSPRARKSTMSDDDRDDVESADD